MFSNKPITIPYEKYKHLNICLSGRKYNTTVLENIKYDPSLEYFLNKKLNENFHMFHEDYNKHNKAFLYHKPFGIWFSCGPDWYNFCCKWDKLIGFTGNSWISNVEVYNLELNDSKLLIIKNMDELKKMNNKYFSEKIDWQPIYKEYSGIKICPNLSDIVYKNEKLYKKLQWISNWRCASGCIWKRDGIIKTKYGGYLPENKTYTNFIHNNINYKYITSKNKTIKKKTKKKNHLKTFTNFF